MKYKLQNIRILTPAELLTILCKSTTLYSEYILNAVPETCIQCAADTCYVQLELH